MFLDDDRCLYPKPGGGGGGFVGKDKSLTEGTKTFSQDSAKPTPKPIINSAPPKSTPPKKR